MAKLYSPESPCPSGHFSEIKAKKNGTDLAPFYFLVNLQSHWINMPDMISVLFDCTVRREVAHIGNVQHRFCGPLFLKLVKFVDFILTIDIAAIIRQYLVVIAEVDQRINQIAIAPRFFRTEYTAADLRQHLMQLLIFLVVFTRFVALTTQFFNFFRRVTKDKDIVSTDMIQHLDVRTVQ